MTIKYQATLRYGQTYVYAGQKFEQGIPGKKLLTEAQKKYLETHAVYVQKMTTGERNEVCAFDFVSRQVGAAPAADEGDQGNDDQSDAAAQGSEGGDEGAGADNGAGEGDQGGGDGGSGGDDTTGSAAASVPPGVRPPRRGRTA